MNELDESRQKINDIDREMAKLFEKRMKAASDVAEYKKKQGLPVLDLEREHNVIDKNSEYISDPEIRSFYPKFMNSVMDVSKDYQLKLLSGTKIAYCGIEGAFAYIAAKRIFPEAELISYPSFSDAYYSVENGECSCAVLPIENSSTGEVGQVSDLMFNGDLHINAVYSLKVSQNLLAVHGASLSDIRSVISHAQALEQCYDYIKEHGFDMIQCDNTAVAAKRVSELNDKSVAAIASIETAMLYSLDVLEAGINSGEMNYTRFAVFSPVREKIHEDSVKNDLILVFVVKNEAGSLLKAVDVISSFGYNMKVLRSRPLKGLPWQYYFYVEAEGSTDDLQNQEMISALKGQCEVLKVLGTCPSHLEV